MKTTVIIKKNRDFTRMYRRAKTKTSPLLVTYCARNRLGHNRIGITASKRVGDAVRRNRAIPVWSSSCHRAMISFLWPAAVPPTAKCSRYSRLCCSRSPH